MGSSVSKAALEATTDELVEPDSKHLADITHYINASNMGVKRLADVLSEKAKSSSWVVVFKALITVHHLMVHGNERFIRHLASRSSLFTLHNFLDNSVIEGYAMSIFIRRYSRYLNEKSLAYRLIAYDVTKTKRGLDGFMRNMNTKDLLNTLPVIQTQFDALLSFNANANELTNRIIRAAFMLLFKDSLRLFAAYNEGILNLLDKFFHMTKRQCNESLDIYIKFLAGTTKLEQFLKVAEQVGIDQNNIPYLTQAPNSLLEALKQHLASLDEKNEVFPPYSLQHSLIQSISKNSFMKASSRQNWFSEIPVNKSDTNCHQSSEAEFTERINWQLNMDNYNYASDFWDPVSISPLLRMVPIPVSYPVNSEPEPVYGVIPASVGAPFPISLPSMDYTRQDLETNRPPTLFTENQVQFM
ncbi:phosphatidylinositol-binding clathrin assembly protein-like isoform X4 [Eptesicus fuscus]|uniref:phosphatidylinositol-binding clathrin assembly protein-like isoform X4 n=1 Tax=Eptesicus fuscus TaxID=29078 RepID=UPI002403F2E9|nr:phosphatidylinositol-binding clathrin assembly protein-like isoform X4 [Eptesicus fuscus]